MTLRWRFFEKTTRRRIREEVRQSEVLRTEYKLARKAARRHYQIRSWVMRVIGLCAFLLLVSLQGIPLDHIIALIFLWTLGTMFLRAAQLHAALYYAPDLNVFDLLPISNDDIFTVQWRQFLLLSFWSVFDFAAAYSILLVHSSGGLINAIAAGVALALIQWIFILAIAVCLFAFASRKYFDSVAWPLQASAIILLFAGANHPRLCQWLASLACWLPPLGSILQALGISENKGPIHDFLPGLMAVGVLTLAPIAYRRVRGEFALSEPRPASDGRSQALQELGEQYAQTPEEAQATIQGRQFLAGFDWQNAGFVEQFASRLLNPRERMVAEFMVAANPLWTPHLRRLFITVSFAVVLGWMFAASMVSSGPMIAFFAIYFLWASFSVTWRGFAPPRDGSLQSPIYAVYPVGFWELMRAVLKINLARCVICVPNTVGALAILAQNPQLSRATLAWTGLKIIAVGFMIQPILAFAPISPGTNDTQKLRLAMPAAMLIFILVGTTITFFLAWNFWVVAVAGLVTALLSILTLILYGRWFNCGRFDLIPLTKMDSAVPDSGQ